MSVILQPGDKIHLAFPLTQRTVPAHQRQQAEAEALREAENTIAFYRAEYARLGVEVAFHTSSATITVPTVVAAFRNPEDTTR